MRKLALFFAFCFTLSAANSYAKLSADDSLKISGYIQSAKENLTINDSVALSFSEKALVLSKSNQNQTFIVKSLILKSNALLNLGDMTGFREALAEARALFSEKDNLQLSLSYHSIWSIYFYNENKLDSCLQNVLKTMKIAEELKDTSLIVNFTIKLQRIYSELNNYEEALRYNNKAIKLSSLGNNSKTTAECFYSRAYILNNIEQHDSALSYLDKAFLIQQQRKDTTALTVILSNLAFTYSQMGNQKKAIEIAKQSYFLRKKQGNPLRIVQSLLDVSNYYIANNQAKFALIYLDSCKTYFPGLKNNHSLIVYYETLSDAYEKDGDYQKAFVSYKKAIALKDSVFSAESKEKITALQKDYEITSRENQIQLLDKTNQVKQLELEKRKNQIILFVSLALLMLILLLVAFRAYRSKKKLNLQLNKTNEKINNQNVTLRTLNTELILSEENLTKANATKDQLISILSHDMYNPVTAVINYTNQVVEKSDGMPKKELTDSLLKVNAAVIPLQDLLDNILQWARTQKKTMQPSIVDLDISEVLSEIIQLYAPAAKFKNISIVTTFSGSHIYKSDRLMMFFILRNILNNAVKFCNAGKQISISISKNENSFLISIKDEGDGFDERVLKRLNSNNEREDLISTHGSGIGLGVSRQFVKLLKGRMEFTNPENSGAVVTLIFPLNF